MSWASSSDYQVETVNSHKRYPCGVKKQNGVHDTRYSTWAFIHTLIDRLPAVDFMEILVFKDDRLLRGFDSSSLSKCSDYVKDMCVEHGELRLEKYHYKKSGEDVKMWEFWHDGRKSMPEIMIERKDGVDRKLLALIYGHKESTLCYHERNAGIKNNLALKREMK